MRHAARARSDSMRKSRMQRALDGSLHLARYLRDAVVEFAGHADTPVLVVALGALFLVDDLRDRTEYWEVMLFNESGVVVMDMAVEHDLTWLASDCGA